MRFWIDTQLPPSLAKWIAHEIGIEASALRDVGLRDAPDFEIFEVARKANVVILTKTPTLWNWFTPGARRRRSFG